jgi:hypothetical protein
VPLGETDQTPRHTSGAVGFVCHVAHGAPDFHWERDRGQVDGLRADMDDDYRSRIRSWDMPLAGDRGRLQDDDQSCPDSLSATSVNPLQR